MADWVVQRAGSAEEFSALAGPLLSRHPVQANVLLTVLASALAGRQPVGGTTWLVVRDPAGRVIGFFAPITMELADRYARAAAQAYPVKDLRKGDPNGKGYTTAEVLEHLKSLEPK